jgi:LPS sulfotransferase NodH
MKPHISYVICAVQRSGSFLLCEALKNTGLAGKPEEYFLNGEGWEDGWWARQHGITSRAGYLNLVLDKGTSPNYEPTAIRILEYLKIPYPKNIVFGERRLQKQADALNETWVEKYNEMKHQAGELLKGEFPEAKVQG